MTEIASLLSLILAGAAVLGLAYTVGVKVTKLEMGLATMKARLDLVYQILIEDPMRSLAKKGIVNHDSEWKVNPSALSALAPKVSPEIRAILVERAQSPLPDSSADLTAELVGLIGWERIRERSRMFENTVAEYLAILMVRVRELARDGPASG